MAPHSSTLAWKISWTEEPGGLQSIGSLRVGHDWATSLFTFMHWRRQWQPTLSILAWRIPGTEEPSGLPFMGLHRVGHDWSDLAAAAAAAAAACFFSNMDFLYFFFFFAQLYWLEPPVQCWIDVIRVDIFVFFLPLGENIQLFTINYSVRCMLIIDTLDQVKEVFFYSWGFLM